MKHMLVLLACLLALVAQASAAEQPYFVLGNRCAPSQAGKPPVCQLIGWPADSAQAQLQSLPWEAEPGHKSDKLVVQPSTVATAR